MAKQDELEKAIENVNGWKQTLETSQDAKKVGRILSKVGLGSLTYLGLRSFIGPEIDIYANEFTPLNGLDCVGIVLSVYGLVGGIIYGAMHLQKKSDEKDLKEAESELEKLSGDGKFINLDYNFGGNNI